MIRRHGTKMAAALLLAFLGFGAESCERQFARRDAAYERKVAKVCSKHDGVAYDVRKQGACSSTKYVVCGDGTEFLAPRW